MVTKLQLGYNNFGDMFSPVLVYWLYGWVLCAMDSINFNAQSAIDVLVIKW
jgi:hypothetical protein